MNFGKDFSILLIINILAPNKRSTRIYYTARKSAFCRKNTFVFCYFAKLAMQSFHGIGRINQFSYLRRISKIGGNISDSENGQLQSFTKILCFP